MQVLTYVYRVRPTRAQHAALIRILHVQCRLYNAALEERIAAWRHGVPISLNDLGSLERWANMTQVGRAGSFMR